MLTIDRNDGRRRTTAGNGNASASCCVVARWFASWSAFAKVAVGITATVLSSWRAPVTTAGTGADAISASTSMAAVTCRGLVAASRGLESRARLRGGEWRSSLMLLRCLSVTWLNVDCGASAFSFSAVSIVRGASYRFPEGATVHFLCYNDLEEGFFNHTISYGKFF